MKIRIQFAETRNKFWYALVPVAFVAGVMVNAAIAGAPPQEPTRAETMCELFSRVPSEDMTILSFLKGDC